MLSNLSSLTFLFLQNASKLTLLQPRQPLAAAFYPQNDGSLCRCLVFGTRGMDGCVLLLWGGGGWGGWRGAGLEDDWHHRVFIYAAGSANPMV